jgi:hypothetical protein
LRKCPASKQARKTHILGIFCTIILNFHTPLKFQSCGFKVCI